MDDPLARLRPRPRDGRRRRAPARRSPAPAPPRTLIDEDEYARDERLPYWAELWPSALVLAERAGRARPAGPAGGGARLRRRPARRRRRRSAAPTSSRPTGTTTALAFTARQRRRRRRRASRTLLVDWNAPPAAAPRPPAPARPRRSAPTSSTRSATAPALAALLPRLLRPGGEVLIADPRRPHAAGLLDAPRPPPAGRTRREDVRHAGRAGRVGPGHPSAPAVAPAGHLRLSRAGAGPIHWPASDPR